MGVSDVEGYKVESSIPRGKSRGQSLVEFALASLVFVTILAISVDFARVFSAYIMVGNMARAGAQQGSIASYYGAETSNDAELMMYEAVLDEQSSIFGQPPTVFADATQVDPDDNDLCIARVTVIYEFQPILPIPLGEPIEISRTSEMRGQILNRSVCS